MAKNIEANKAIDDEALYADKAFYYVIRQICEGHLHPGEKINNREIAEELHISHTPVREALTRLLDHGWIKRTPKFGAYVSQFTLDEIKQIYSLREVIEVGVVFALGNPQNNVTTQQLSEMEEIVTRIESGFQDVESKLYENADIDFHRKLVDFVGNKRLSNIFDSIILQSKMIFPVLGFDRMKLFMEFYEASGFDTSELKANHRKIFQAIADKDINKGVQLITQHIRGSFIVFSWLRNIVLKSKLNSSQS